jgi:hypothetical protein
MDHIIRIGMATSKHVFQLHGVNAAEEPVPRRKLRRNDMVVFFERLAPTIIAIEAAGASHHWARLLGPDEFGVIDLANHSSGGDTRVVGIYTDPLIRTGEVQVGSPFDSETRF